MSLKDACLQNHLTLGVVSEPQWCQPQRGLHQSRPLWQEGEASAKALFLVPLYTCQAVFQQPEMHYLTCTSTKAKHLLAVSGSTSSPACDCLTCADITKVYTCSCCKSNIMGPQIHVRRSQKGGLINVQITMKKSQLQ